MRKFVIILRGESGSGKSTIADLISKEISCQVVSADYYFVNDYGGYEFDSTKLGYAHSYCWNEFVNSINHKVSVIIIDNTNTQQWEMDKYIQRAIDNDYHILFVEPDNRAIPVEILAERNVHSVSEAIISKQRHRFEPTWKVTVNYIKKCFAQEEK